jgi:hypothetical protein
MRVSLDPWGHSRQINLIEDLNARDLGRPNLLKDILNSSHPSGPIRIRSIHNVQEQIGVGRLLERGLEGLDKCMGQGLDEPHCVRKHHETIRGFQKYASTGGVEGGKELIGSKYTGMGERIEKGGLPRIGVAHQRNVQRAGLLAGSTPIDSLLLQRGQARLELAHPLADKSAVGLELRLTRPAQSNSALLPFEVCPSSNEPRREVIELGEFHLKLPLVAAGPKGKNIEYQGHTVDDPLTDQTRKIALLGCAELMVEDNQLDAH